MHRRELLPVRGYAGAALPRGLLQRRFRGKLHGLPSRLSLPHRRHEPHPLQPRHFLHRPREQLHVVPAGILLPEHGSRDLPRVPGRDVLHRERHVLRDLPRGVLLPAQDGGGGAALPRRILLGRGFEELHRVRSGRGVLGGRKQSGGVRSGVLLHCRGERVLRVPGGVLLSEHGIGELGSKQATNTRGETTTIMCTFFLFEKYLFKVGLKMPLNTFEIQVPKHLRPVQGWT